MKNSFRTFLVLCLCLSTFTEIQAVNSKSSTTISANNKVRSASEKKVKPSWSQKLVLKVLQKKQANQTKKQSSNKAFLLKLGSQEQEKFNANDLSLVAGLTAIGSFFLGTVVPYIIFLSMIATVVAIIAGLIGLSKKKARKKRGIWGLVLGGLMAWFWVWLLNNCC